MGSQRVAKISEKKASSIRSAILEFDEVARLDPPKRRRKISGAASSAAVGAIGSFSKTGSFVQCLSSQNVKEALKGLIDMAGKFEYKGSPDEVFDQYDVDPDNKHPFTQLVDNMLMRLKENLMASQKSTETALAIDVALPQTVLDILAMSMPRAKALAASRQKFAEAFKNSDRRVIANTLLQNVIPALIDRVLDAARGDIPPDQVGRLKTAIRKHFAPKLVKVIDGLARKRGTKPSEIPSKISTDEWVDALRRVVEEYQFDED